MSKWNRLREILKSEPARLSEQLMGAWPIWS